MPSLRIPHVANSKDKIQLFRISHVYFEQPDVEQFAKFAEAFGLFLAEKQGQTSYFRGYGKDQYVYVATQSNDGGKHFKGPAFVAASAADFDKASQLPTASVQDLDGPGGGKIVTIKRPGNTFFHIIYGQKDRTIDSTAATATHESLRPFNTSLEKPRRGQFQRYRPGPALVHKLGHCGYVCKDFDEEAAFYTQTFNFVPSDVLYPADNPDMDVLVFFHLDLGSEYSDHHCLFLQRAQPDSETYVHHTSYEVEDFDTQLIGHQWLADKGYEAVWGVGRHVLGSQIFDYWKDPSGFKIEHYADGDLVNEAVPTKRDIIGALSVWGPELPKTFFDDEVNGPIPNEKF